MQVSLVIRNGNLVFPDKVVKGDVLIKDGKIVAITRDSALVQADRIINADGKYVLPGAIDPHVHFGIYSGSFESDVETETGAMALGGVTTPMHYLQENGSYLDKFEKVAGIIEKKALVDVAFQVVLMNQIHLEEISEYPKYGIFAGKIYMNGKEYRILGIESDVDDAFLYKAFQISKRFKFLPKLHCENYDLVKAINESFNKDQYRGLPALDAVRPAFCEEEAMRRAMFISKYTRVPIYIAHNTTAAAQTLSRQAVVDNQKVWFETCPHYLTFTKDDDIGILGKVNPPIRSAEQRESLWSGIKRGLIHVIGSDHAPNRLKSKKGKGDIWTALLGFGGSPFIFPTLITEGVKKRQLDLPTIARITSYNAACIHGIEGKGLLMPGYDADIVVIDIRRNIRVTAEMLGSYADYSLFDNMKMAGWPAYTLSRGRIVAEDLKIVRKSGKAKFVRCKKI